ncbi:MAG: hypothetical protein JWP49_1333 [Phenylobacterium sp.]|jgi:hypothetical protein|nr:hypothetical protein [Phenylobacterium sp.]
MMGAPELDAATADAIAGEITRASRHALPLGAPCPNCGTPLKGAWCYACGQKGEEYHRSIWHLVAEAFEGLTHVDGRVWKTLPRLLVRPGQLTRDFLDGHRAAQIPPFRLFLVALLLVFFAGGLSVSANPVNFNLRPINDPKALSTLSPKDRADVDAAMKQIRAASAEKAVLAVRPVAGSKAFWIARVRNALDKPESVLAAMEQWGHRLAFLMLPIAALLLAPLFAFKKGVYLFDHLIFAMHSLSFQGLLLTLIFLGGLAVDGAAWLLLLAPVHLFVHMRGTYRTGVFGTLSRMFVLFIGSTVAVSVLLVGLIIIGLASAH